MIGALLGRLMLRRQDVVSIGDDGNNNNKLMEVGISENIIQIRLSKLDAWNLLLHGYRIRKNVNEELAFLYSCRFPCTAPTVCLFSCFTYSIGIIYIKVPLFLLLLSQFLFLLLADLLLLYCTLLFSHWGS